MPQPSSLRYRIAHRIAHRLSRLVGLIGGPAWPRHLDAVTVRVDDDRSGGAGRGWVSFTGGPNDRDHGEIQQQYTDALEAWRKNPMAKRIVDCITDYVLGDGMKPAASGDLGAFVHRWWTHPKNHMDLRLPVLVDELTRAGDLFVTLHRNPQDGLSYVRPIPKDRILKIETLPKLSETRANGCRPTTPTPPRQTPSWSTMPSTALWAV